MSKTFLCCFMVNIPGIPRILFIVYSQDVCTLCTHAIVICIVVRVVDVLQLPHLVTHGAFAIVLGKCCVRHYCAIDVIYNETFYHPTKPFYSRRRTGLLSIFVWTETAPIPEICWRRGRGYDRFLELVEKYTAQVLLYGGRGKT